MTNDNSHYDILSRPYRRDLREDNISGSIHPISSRSGFSRNRYKVIFLDWNLTLSNSMFWEHLQITDPQKYQTIEDSLFFDNKDLIAPWMRGEFNTEDILRVVAKETSIDYITLLDDFIFSCETMKFYSERIPAIIKRLQKHGYQVVIATDNMDSFIRWTVSAMKLDLIFDDILDSYSLKSLKKDFKNSKSVFFGNFLKKHHLKPAECILFDDAIDREDRLKGYGLRYERVDNIGELEGKLEYLLA